MSDSVYVLARSSDNGNLYLMNFTVRHTRYNRPGNLWADYPELAWQFTDMPTAQQEADKFNSVPENPTVHARQIRRRTSTLRPPEPS
jgi:hypothetical protein